MVSSHYFANEFCVVFEDYYPINNFIPNVPQHNGILLLFSGVVNCIMSVVTIYWIKQNEFSAEYDVLVKQEEAIKNVIFPVFVKVLWLSAFINVYAAAVTILIPQSPNNTGSVGTNISFSFHYAMMRTLQHSVVEGIAFLLMQKGCGKYANKRAFLYTALWGALTFSIMFLSYGFGGEAFVFLNEAWNILLFLFYLVLWATPQKNLFRRPAAIKYCQFWAIFRFIIVLINIFYWFPATYNVGACGFIFVNLLFLAVIQPLICYWTLKQDSRWWQGVEIYQGAKSPSVDGIRSPLIGTEFDLSSAQSLAMTLDRIPVTGQVKMLNFASLKLDMKKLLGSGSFSKVYRGTYRGSEVAIKLIYTADLTTEIIMRVAAEASILSSIRHPNVVHIVGLTVLPPSVCLILEICSFGSLSDIIRGYGFDWNATHRSPLSICRTDAVYLALGCARGLAAVHAYDNSICHRDVKSFNFLVDAHFNVKIADLELGVASQFKQTKSSKKKSGSKYDKDVKESNDKTIDPSRQSVDVQCLLGNWLAPEVLSEKKFVQASDVYSLGTVMWEIISRQLPFASDSQAHIHIKIREGYKHPIPQEYFNTPLAKLIDECWEQDPGNRPTGVEIVARLENILYHECHNYVKHIEGGAIVKTTALVEYYEAHYKKSGNSTRISDYISPKKAAQKKTNTYIDFHSITSRMTKSEVNNSWTSLFRYEALDQDEKDPPPPVENADNMQKLSTGSASLINEDGLRLSGINNYPSSHSLNSGSGGNNSSSSNLLSNTSLMEEAVISYSSAASDLESGSGIHTIESETTASGGHNIQYLEASSISTGNTRNNKDDTIIPPVPRAALDVIGIVKEEQYWLTLNATGAAWAVVTTQYPHVVMHATGQWYRLFGINQMMSSHSKLVSLVSLAESFSVYNNLEGLQESAGPVGADGRSSSSVPGSNMYVNEPANVNRNAKTLKTILKELKQYKEVHSVLSFFVNNKQAPGGSTGYMAGYNMMCTMHGYPISAVNQYTYNTSGSSNSQRRNQDTSVPIYYAILFNELKEQVAVAPEVNLSDGVVGSYNSKSSSSVLGRFFSPSTFNLGGGTGASRSNSRSWSRSWSTSK